MPLKKKFLSSILNEKNDTELELLLKNILSAAKLNFDEEIALLKLTSHQKYSSIDLLEKLSAKDLLLFGINPTNLGINYSIKQYQTLSCKKQKIPSN